MKGLLPRLSRVALTVIALAVAALVFRELWAYYMEEPWTRDGRVRADVVALAADVSGLVAEVLVRDNQEVRKGDVLFRIDRARFLLALQQADANLEARRATRDEAIRERDRYQRLSEAAVSIEKQEQTTAAARTAEANFELAVADRAVAQLNLERSEVTSPVNGMVTNLELRPGDYVTAGNPVAAIVDSDTFYVVGYFEETKLRRIRVGDRAAIRIMAEDRMLTGRVESIAGGIEDRERTAGSRLLPNINPTFSWVRLAQRVPVRVALESVPPELRLISGRTATVTVLPGSASTEQARLPQ